MDKVMANVMAVMTRATERGLVPDPLSRGGIRNLLTQRLASLPAGVQELSAYTRDLVAAMDASPVALCTEEANAQHYEVPADYFATVLGPNRKYSCCYWGAETRDLAAAEAAALAITCRRAGIADGQRILELGCGWGSLSLWMASHYPGARITAVPNSTSQKQWIDSQARQRGLVNLEVVTADMNHFDCHGGYDRVVSVEMFEHMRNWRQLTARVAGWLRGGGKLFIHVFCHRSTPYFFETGDPNDWMSRHFFSGGLMPSADLPLRFQDQLVLEDQWLWSGEHYAKTLAAWLANHDRDKDQVMALFRDVYGDHAQLWFVRWRLFYLACEELFRFNGGNEWFVGHYLFARRELAHD